MRERARGGCGLHKIATYGKGTREMSEKLEFDRPEVKGGAVAVGGSIGGRWQATPPST